MSTDAASDFTSLGVGFLSPLSTFEASEATFELDFSFLGTQPSLGFCGFPRLNAALTASSSATTATQHLRTLGTSSPS